MEDTKQFIRNFCIIAHIDHGKSTLADRFIEKSKIVSAREFQNQFLDTMDIERERGITIKSQAITIPYKDNEENIYQLNLVDTPGHVDFSYEVSRAISSCEGALLLIDASQGVEAQTLSNLYMALEHDLEIIPVINKIDLPSAEIDMVMEQIEHDLGLDSNLAIQVSAKNGIGIDELLQAIILQVSPPSGKNEEPLKALIFDSTYDPYRGVIVYIRVFSGVIKSGMTIRLMHNNADYKVDETGIFRIGYETNKSLQAGEVGYLIGGIKNISDIEVGDTITDAAAPCDTPLPGFRRIKPVVFSSIFPIDTNDYEELWKAIEKLKLNDSSLVYEKDTSAALGFGFRCGFLGLLHLEVVQERLRREFKLGIIFTAPSVKYKIVPKDGEPFFIDNPQDYPDPETIEYSEEPYITAEIMTPSEFLGNIMTLCREKRGIQKHMHYLDEKRIEISYDMPLAEVLFDFYDKLKSSSKGYASFDYDIAEYKRTNVVKLEILVNGKSVDALSQLVFRDNAYDRARTICKNLTEEIPRKQFKIPIQGAIGGSIIARETIQALKKDVTAKCYGGDITRKRKLIEKQKEGKKKMKQVGSVELPQSAFLSALKTREE